MKKEYCVLCDMELENEVSDICQICQNKYIEELLTNSINHYDKYEGTLVIDILNEGQFIRL